MSDPLVQEWMKRDPFLLDLEGFQAFCDIRLSGSNVPMSLEDIFQTVETIRKPFEGCARELIGTAVGTCTPSESSEDYWKRNNIAAETVRAVIALNTKKNDEQWPLHLNDSRRHLEWIEAEFGVALSEEDYDAAWLLWEHKYWFTGDNGYYVKGWLAVADALGCGSQARMVLEQTPFPHANEPTVHETTYCKKMKVCPIYQYREWLRLTPIDIPELVFRHTTFQSNLNYYLRINQKDGIEAALKRINDPNTDFRTKWLIIQMIENYKQLPPCKLCGELSYWHWRAGCDSDLKEREDLKGLELCWTHIRIIHKTYETRIMPLKFQSKAGGSYGLMPDDVEKDLRKRMIEGDAIFDGVTLDDKE